MLSETEAVVGTNARATVAANRIWKIIVNVHGVVQDPHFNYPAYHEVAGWGGYKGAGLHQTFTPTFEKYAGDMATIVGGAVKAELS